MRKQQRQHILTITKAHKAHKIVSLTPWQYRVLNFKGFTCLEYGKAGLSR